MRNCSFHEVLEEMFMERWLSEKTQLSYRGPVKLFQEYVGLDVLPSEISRHCVLLWRKSLVKTRKNPSGIVEASWNNYARHLSAVYNFGIEQELIPLAESPFKDVKIREPRRRKKTLRETDIRFVREALELCRRYEIVRQVPAPLHPAWFWRVVVEMFYQTGIRLNQLLCMTPRDVHLSRGRIIATAEGAKNKFENVLPITESLYPYLVELLTSAQAIGIRADDQLFNVNRFSQRHRCDVMNTDQVEKFFQRLSKCCGSRISPHRFRHTLATDLMRSPGRDLYLTQQVCGHTDIRSTLEYVHPDLQVLAEYLTQRHVRPGQPTAGVSMQHRNATRGRGWR